MEASLHAIEGKFDPPLSVIDDNEKKPEVTSADPAKAKRKFPWTKKEVHSEESGTVPAMQRSEDRGKVDWVFKVSLANSAVPSEPGSIATSATFEGSQQKVTTLSLPKPKLSGSREWLTNLFSPNKSRNSSSSTTDTNSRYLDWGG